jgi:hypothetical protein
MSALFCGCDPEVGWLCTVHGGLLYLSPDGPQTLGRRATNPKFETVITQMVAIHNRKSADYATDGNRYSNFEESAAYAGCSVDTVFLVMIGVKLARLRELLSSGKTAQNESVQDSRMDLAVYAALWASYHTEAP